MLLFCFLWIPLFYLFRHSLSEANTSVSGIWALILGSIVALAQFFLGDLIYPGGFGLSRWINALVDIVVLPAVLPLFIYMFFLPFRFSASSTEFTNFALLWLIPNAALRAVSWSASSDPVLLVLVPILWTALVCGIPFFVGCIRAFPRWYLIILSLLGIFTLPFLAATAWRAFFSQRLLQGFLLLGFTLLPMLGSLVIAWIRSGKSEK
jgi:hypothetical protein